MWAITVYEGLSHSHAFRNWNNCVLLHVIDGINNMKLSCPNIVKKPETITISNIKPTADLYWNNGA